MKYLLLSILLLSTTTFAQSFDANLLVGKWQCFVKFDDTHLKGTERISVEYRNDGTYTTKSVLNTTIQNVDFELKNPKSLMEITALGQWQINKNIYSEARTDIVHYFHSNQELEQLGEFEKKFAEDKEFEHNLIMKLSKTQFHYQTELSENIVKCKRV